MALLDPDKIVEQYKTAHTSMRPLWDNFDEYERIARNKPHPKVIAAKLPTVTDGTLAGVIAAQPKRVIQQVPTGKIKSIDQPGLAEIVNYIWINEILPNANYNGTPLQKSWIMGRKALTYGCQASYAFFRQSGDYFGVDFSLPYIRDIIFEAGKSYGPDCDVLYMRQWYTESQIKLIIERETKLSLRAKGRGDNYEGKWNVEMLQRALELKRQKDADAATPQEREKGLINKFIEIIHCFQTGVGAKFYSFSPDIEAMPGEGSTPIVRTDTNPDPRGKMPISFMYADIDLSSALGVGYPEMAGGMQNLLDSEVQAYQFLQLLGLNPPVQMWGTTIKKPTIKYKSGAVWDMGSDMNSKIEVVDIATKAMESFAVNYGMIKSQILNLTPQSQANIASEAGNSQSKTNNGVAQIDKNMGFEDNYVRKMYETWWETNSETMLNIHFARAQGTREVQLTAQFLKSQPNFSAQAGENGDMPGVSFIPAAPLAEGDPLEGKAKVDYSAIKTKIRWQVDPTSSQVPDDETQAADLDNLIQEVNKAPYLYYYMLQAGYRLNLGEAYKARFELMGIRNIDNIIEKLPMDASGPSPEQLRGVLNPLFDKPSISIPYDSIPAAAAVQVLANAGVNVTELQVREGPVIDPNARGVETPITASNPNLPSGDQGAAAAAPAALGPDGKPLAEQPTTPTAAPLAVPAAAAAVPIPVAPGGPAQNPQLPAPVPQDGPVPAPGPAAPVPQLAPDNGLSPADKSLIQHFLAAGYDSQQAVQALALAHKGAETAQIVAALGKPTRSPLGAKKKVEAK